MTDVQFERIIAPTPEFEDVAAEFEAIEAKLEVAESLEACAKVIARWEVIRRRIETWQALVELRFNQDTTNEQYKKDRDHSDAMRPKITDLEVRLKRKLLTNKHRPELEGRFGSTCFAIWDSDVAAFDPAIEDDLVRESKLEAEYVELMASAEIPFRDETHNISQIQKFSQESDRQVRHDAAEAMWQWFANHGEKLDSIFDGLVGLRHGMATKLGYDDFIGLGYKRMCRIDYNREDVDRFRATVREHLVPLCSKIVEQQASVLGIEKVMAWDEPVHDLAGNPKPKGDHDWMLERAQEMFDAMGGGLGEFFGLMRKGDLMDLQIRKGKAGGGFCTSFPSYGMPYIFANFNGTKGDVEVFTHEIGHAFQCYQSRHQTLSDYLWPTYESCEIHSMGLEFLTWPHMEKFFGEDASRFRRTHLTQSLLFIPYGVAVDHFQHNIYDEPEASASRRHEMWREIAQTYMPWRDWGDIAYANQGGRWQLQQHIFNIPFYYIDYTLAQTCALQLWVGSQQNFDETMKSYVALCKRGGEAPFQELVRDAGLISPFAEGCLQNVVAQAQAELAD